MLPGGFSPRPPFSRFARHAVAGVHLHHCLDRASRSEGPVSNSVSTRDSAPSEARKRGSGGGSPRKHDDLLTGPFGPAQTRCTFFPNSFGTRQQICVLFGQTVLLNVSPFVQRLAADLLLSFPCQITPEERISSSPSYGLLRRRGWPPARPAWLASLGLSYCSTIIAA
jgi:hypothetical protein